MKGEVAHPVLNIAAWFTLAVIAALSLYLFSRLNVQIVLETLHSGAFWSAVAVGFFAQAVDGALGMAYGVTATTFLLGAGASPAAASASVHIAEIFTTGFSGVAHLKYGNVNRQLFLRLLVQERQRGARGDLHHAVRRQGAPGRTSRPIFC